MTTRDPERTARSLITLGAAAALLGVTFAVTGSGGIGGWLVVLGLGALVAGTHRFGRLGPA